MINILLVDESRIFSQGLSLILNQEKDMNVIGTAMNVMGIKKVIVKPDIMLVNTQIESESIDEITSTLIKTFPDGKVIYVLPFVDKSRIIKGIDSGVDGFILNGHEPDSFIDIIRNVYRNQYVMSGEIAKVMMDEIQIRHYDEKEILQQRLEERNINATKRDLDVLYLIFKEKNNKEIAEMLDLTEKTIRDYVSMAYKRINIKNRGQVYHFLTEIMKD
ncbi:response regulator transcription factor [Virgibacillus halotolerans]|uniref:LuxR C-terminal-related transcriptional regulator n=1 Tax=Virgibacillus halotolerans TaxID=1071053 RepID=UPI00195F71BD|nr:response regulator transcription factor [Virgibacillus halotolerans]